MPTLPPLLVRLEADASRFMSQMKLAETQVERMSKKGASDMEKMSAVGRRVFLGAGAAAVGLGIAGLKAASDLEETRNKAQVAFGDSEKSVESFANTMADKFGASKNVMLDAAAGFGLITNSAGLTKEASAQLGIAFVKAADDATSLFNTPLPQMLADIKSGLAGQMEPLRKYGIDLSEAAVKNQLLKMGIESVSGEFTQQQKVIARSQLMLQGLSVAAGDHERTQGTLANRLREVQGRAVNLAAAYGAVLMPATIGALNGGLQFAEMLSKNKPLAVGLAAVIGGPLVVAMGAYIATQAKSLYLTGLQAASKLPQAFLAIGAAVRGTTAANVVLNESLLATNLTMAAGLGLVGLVAAGFYSVAAAQRAARGESQQWAASQIGGLTTTQQKLDETNRLIQQQRDHVNDLKFNIRPDFWNSWQRVGEDKMDSLEKQARDLAKQLENEKVSAHAAAVGTKELAAAAGDAASKADDFNTRLDALRSNMLGVISAQKSFKDAQRAVTAATDQQSAAQKNLDDLLAAGAVDVKAVTAAEKDLERATRRVNDAREDRAAAERDLQDAMKGASATDVEKAELELNAAKRAQERATIGVSKAQKSYSETLFDSKSSVTDLWSASLDIKDAYDEQKKAAWQVQDAEKALADLKAKGTPATEAYKEAQKRLAEATQAVKDAEDGAAESQQKLDDAKAGDPEFNDKVAAARDAVAKATQGVADANSGAADAAVAYKDAQSKANETVAYGIDLVSSLAAEMSNLKAQFPETSGIADAVLKVLAPQLAIQAALKNPGNQKFGELIKFGGARAKGGPVSAGRAYVVGEDGPELLLPTADGTIVPNRATSGGGGNVTINVNGVSVFDREAADRLADRIAPALRRRQNRGGSAS